MAREATKEINEEVARATDTARAHVRIALKDLAKDTTMEAICAEA